MPQDGESPLARFVHAIVNEDGFAFGPLALSDDGVTIQIPIVRRHRGRRGYVLAGEVSDYVSGTDPGAIDRVGIRNDSPRLVLLPPGSILVGKGTTSRATTSGVLLEPRSSMEIEVRCVHASQAIVANARLELAPVRAPDEVRRALLSRDQGLVWASVRSYMRPRNEAAPRSDDLVDALGPSAGPSRGPVGPPSALPSLEDVCGAITLGPHGAETVEVFESPESWNAAEEHAVRRTDEGVSQASSREIRPVVPEHAIDVAKAFLLRLLERGQRHIASTGWTSLDSSCAWTVQGGGVIHLLAFREDPWTYYLSVHAPGTVAATDVIAPGYAVRPTAAVLDAASGEGDAATASLAAVEVDEVAEPAALPVRPHRRKVLSSGWDTPTFDSLERCARKEFGGDRSAAMRFFVRQGLGRRGYLGPRPPPAPAAVPALPVTEEGSAALETRHAAIEVRILDYERIARTEGFATWLRLRARSELERLASSVEDSGLQEAAQASLSRLRGLIPEPEAEEAPEPEALPQAPPLDVRPLLRRAFAVSAAGQFSDALHLFDEVLAAEPENRTALLGRAVALRRSGKSQEALATLDRVLRIEPANAAALLNRGRILQERGELQGALATFERLAEVAPNDWDVWMARGDVLARMGREHDARVAYTEALRRNPEDASLLARIRALERARMPPQSPASRVALPRDVQEGQSYLVKGGPPDLGYRVFRALLVRSVPGLLITARDADQVRREQGLGEVRIVELTTEPGGDRIPPSSLELLTGAIERFLADNRGRAAVLLDELSALVEANGFRDTALFLGRVNEDILPSQAIFLVSVARGELGEKEAAILERDLRVLS